MGFDWFKRRDAVLPDRERPGEPSQIERLRAEVRERDQDRRLALEVLGILKPSLEPRVLAESIRNACEGPLGLATFYMAIVDYGRDQLSFPLYCEGGKARMVAPRVFSEFGGLTTRVLVEKRSLYFAEKSLQDDAGAAYTDAERITGLIPESWYGLPLGAGPGWPGRPFGVLSFQAFAKDAFSPARREIMDAIGAALALALKTDPERTLRLG
ncbi:MAG TPA: hypothetical protein VL181_05395 [Holophagaceae bacterium]|nr:hypothetical protein [Holophagaceae bacterium]